MSIARTHLALVLARHRGRTPSASCRARVAGRYGRVDRHPTTRSRPDAQRRASCSSPIRRSVCRRRTTCGISSRISAATCLASAWCRSSPRSTASSTACHRRPGMAARFPVAGGARRRQSVGPPRSVEHAWQLRQAIRRHEPRLTLGGWANPNRDVERQVEFLHGGEEFTGEFYLTQIVSHHEIEPVAQFMEIGARKGLSLPMACLACSSTAARIRRHSRRSAGSCLCLRKLWQRSSPPAPRRLTSPRGRSAR